MDQELYQLIHRAKLGETEAFEKLVTRYKGIVFRQAYAMLGDKTEAEDIAQEAFLKVYYSLPELDSAYAFSSWLSRILSRLCYDHQKSKSKISEGSLEEYYPKQPITKAYIENEDLRLDILKAMKKISFEQREVIVLREVQGFSYEEIADILKIPAGTVKSRIHAARTALREELQRGDISG